MSDVVIVGGGVIGLSLAYELAGQGASVRLLEQGDLGREASWAGAGMLPPGNLELATTPEARLRALSHALWPEISKQLLDETSVDNGFTRCGGVEVRIGGKTDALRDEVAVWCQEGVEAEELEVAAALELEPALTADISTAYFLPELGQVRNPWHLKALISACTYRGVELHPGTLVIGFEREGERVTAVRTAGRAYAADQVCIAGGAWSRSLLASVDVPAAIEPVRGQIVMLSMPRPFERVIQVGPRYLVPRADGRILIGATEERVGFLKENTAEAVAGLLTFATRIVPSLASAKLERTWSGLRPGSADGLPYLGRVPEFDNLFVAAGHFRSGLQMSPGTALVMRQLMLGQETAIPLDAYRLDRAAVLSV